ncbi:hypothetical protein IF1G_09299 [Cordyceps javanica]|uniref:Uncharacterized protein n=1 Tax=Cordyceps javanica TaxID=43265 RepID=A0A545URX8_9HYPO|nr:hypothetical protein IF1G_09299 [Cordyceps javanica]
MAYLVLGGSINGMRSFKTLISSWRCLRAIRPSKNSQIGLLSPARRLSLTSNAMMAEKGGPREYRDQYHWIDGAESLEKYRRGGYHPVVIGDILDKRYQIVDKLGAGMPGCTVLGFRPTRLIRSKLIRSKAAKMKQNGRNKVAAPWSGLSDDDPPGIASLPSSYVFRPSQWPSSFTWRRRRPVVGQSLFMYLRCLL